MNLNILTDSSNKNINPRLFVLDPLSVIIKLAILSKKPVGTKLLIKQNVIYFQEPGVFQGITRMYNISSKIDLSHLYNPIQIACSQYLEEDEKLKPLFLYAYKGLERLVDTYRHCTILVHSIYFFQSIIKAKLISKEILAFRDDATTCLYTPELRGRFKNIWTSKKIDAIGHLIELSEMENFDESVNEVAKFNVVALETAILQIDNVVRLNITETSHACENDDIMATTQRPQSSDEQH